ncbi:lysozyme inhibitor LprI family protein [Thermomonas sp.]|uniref:lysozyme inhibitor LprI family protein n=1 Tax=Thermomonas sp. TaxID=1971895 RepID=UPI0035B42FA8
MESIQGEAMRFATRSAAIVMAAMALAGCGKHKATCSGKDELAVVKQIVMDEAEKALAKGKRDDGSAVFSAASARATLSKISIAFDNVRTSKEDPDSTKVFCEGTIKIVVPPDLLHSAEEGRKLAGLGAISALASNNDMEQAANAFTKAIEYNAQPTDDGKKVYAELTGAASIADFVSEIAGSSMLKPMIEAKQIEDAKAAEEANQAAEAQRLQEEQQQAQLRAEQGAANLSVAQEQNTLANQAINELWKGLSEEDREYLLGSQRAWIKKKDVDCKIEAAGRSTDPTEIEIARLNCDTAATRARTDEIRRSL